MKRTKQILKREDGFVLVLAVFMMILLSMIGLASMMIGTTDIEIAGNEKFHEIAFYQSEAGLTIGTEIVEIVDDLENLLDFVDDSGYLDNSSGIVKIMDTNIAEEGKDVALADAAGVFGSGTTWAGDTQSADSIRTDDMLLGSAGSDICPDPPDGIEPDFQVIDDSFCSYCDLDKADMIQLVGGGAEFGSGGEGLSVSARGVIYNIDCVGNLPGSRAAAADHYLGYLYVLHN